VRRAVTATAAVLLVSGLIFALQSLGCRHPRDAANPRAALDAFYAACLSKPSVSGSVDEGPAPAGTVADGRAWNHLVEYGVTYGDGATRFVIVGKLRPDSSWRVIGGEGTGP
jgi:hypothetical protein